MKILSSILMAALFLFSQSSLTADALDNWKPSQVLTNPVGYEGFSLGSLVYGNGRYVAVGSYRGSDSGMIQTSEDGINWTLRASNYSVLDLYDVAFGNGTFVAVGWGGLGNVCLYSSTNGIDWPNQTNGLIANFFRVTYGGGLFIATGDGYLWNSSGMTNRNIYTSPNGINWTARNSGSPASDVHSIWGVAYGAGQFVAVDTQGYFYNSSTGISWTRTFNGYPRGSVSFCNGLFFVPSGPGTNLVSTNGLNWTLLTNNTASAFGRVIYGNGLFMTLSTSNLFTSVDGTNWIHRDFSPATNVSLGDIAMGNRNLVILGNDFHSIPYKPFGYVSDSFVDLSIRSQTPHQLNLSGLQGRTYRIEYLDGLQSDTNIWQTLATFSLTNSPMLWTDPTATNSLRLYRSVLLP